ncbi:site-specific integrase [Flavobacterium beibuense]|uniref:Phage integrase family protein n=1 Tax=Flavobacterium beibuense TaxID=657326 RepID=A0A444WES5_9FLAO|nr:site-specific integrase [Flavobacterium beibuense]RYJ44319.1 Phage integrase family protein [Flavobacterium beibuense]
MLESSFGLSFFMKPQKKETSLRYIYLRITVDGIRKETSTKRTWDLQRWDAKRERAVGTKEDAKTLNHFLDTMEMKINKFKTDLMYTEKSISAERIMDFVLGRMTSKATLLDEFAKHNEEVKALIGIDYALATYKRYEIAKSHIKDFILYKYRTEDIEMRDLDFDFISSYDLYLKTVRNCVNNSALKYITCLKKVIYRAMDKNIIAQDPFRAFKKRVTKTNKKPLTARELSIIENTVFSTARLEVIRDIFIFQCYTGLAYIDAYQLKKTDIAIGIDGEQWIISKRQKTGNSTNIPLLPKALKIIEKYKAHPLCLSRNSVLPVSSNQKMNAYLKEVAAICGLECELNTHKARRTFGSTVTLNNDVPIHVVKEMLGHTSIRQTESYAITTEQTIGREMKGLRDKLNPEVKELPQEAFALIRKLEEEIKAIREKYQI